MTKPHHSTIAATERDKDRERQRRRRAEMRASKKPSTHTVNRAIVEAFAYCVEHNRQAEGKRSDTKVSLREVLEAAIQILAKGDVYDEKLSTIEVVRKTRPPKDGFWRLGNPKANDATTV